MKSKGFTLVEMIVAIAIFMIVAVVAVGALVRIVALNRQAQTVQASVNNLSFALDSMSREVRQGANISCPSFDGVTPFTPSGAGTDCISMSPHANSLIYFETAKVDPAQPTCNLYYAYWFMPSGSNYVLEKAQQASCNEPIGTSGSGVALFYPIIDTNSVTLTDYNLAVFSGPPFFTYKWVFVRIKGYAGVLGKNEDYFDVQTSLSQRVSD